MELQILEDIQEKYSKRKIFTRCRRLLKKCSFKNMSDVTTLCELAYWLYVYGDTDDALNVCKLTDNIPFDGNYNVWTFVHSIWALKARILRESGSIDESKKIVKSIDEHYWQNILGINAEKKRRSNLDIEFVSNKSEIKYNIDDGDVKSANAYRFTGICKMVEYHEMIINSFYDKEKEDVEEYIEEYIKILKET